MESVKKLTKRSSHYAFFIRVKMELMKLAEPVISTRLGWIDIARGIGIIAVVVVGVNGREGGFGFGDGANLDAAGNIVGASGTVPFGQF